MTFILIAILCFAEVFANAYFGKTRRGHQMLLHDDYSYVREKQKQNTTNWKCSWHVRFRCKARAVTKEIDGQHYVRITCGSHTHPSAKSNDDSELELVTTKA